MNFVCPPDAQGEPSSPVAFGMGPLLTTTSAGAFSTWIAIEGAVSGREPVWDPDGRLSLNCRPWVESRNRDGAATAFEVLPDTVRVLFFRSKADVVATHAELRIVTLSVAFRLHTGRD